MSVKSDLFTPVVPESRAHPNFCALRDSPFHGDTRALISSLYARLGDPNGNFCGDFQSDGFHARLFELACFAYLESAGALISREYERPDFLATINSVPIAMEVTTANPRDGTDREISISQVKLQSREELDPKVYVEFPRRVVSILHKKLNKRYHELPQCLGRPLILVVAPFFEPGSITYTDDALLDCLYGYTEPGTPKFVKPAFFSLDKSTSVAAILYCNQFTVPRFFRMAAQANNTTSIKGMRFGMSYIELNKDEVLLTEYSHRLDDPSIRIETWSQGITVFHNPKAKYPLPIRLLPCTSTFHVEDEMLIREVYGFHPVTSMMQVSMP